MTYTIVLTEEQKNLIVKALDKFSQYTLGQTTSEREAAKKLEPKIGKLNSYGSNDLTR
jgi:hypothetical protein